MFFGRREALAASVFPVSGDREILAWVERRAVPAPEGCAAGTVTADYGFAAKELPAAAKKDSYTARFVADGVTVATVGYHPGDRALQEPSVPARAGYTGFWSRYALGEEDITVQAVYRRTRATGGERLSSGTYDLAYGAAGTLTVAAGSSVTLSGEGEDLTLTVEAGARLTLDGLCLRGDTTLLTLGEGCTLCLLGDNSLEVVSDLRSNAAPTLRFAGSLTVTGTGSLRVQAGAGNTAIWSEGGSLVQKSGLLLVKKLDLLGFSGGAVNAATLRLEGGSFLAYTDSDHEPALAVGSVTLAGGSLNVRSMHTEQAVEGTLELAGGSARLEGYSPNSSGAGKTTLNASAASSVTGSGFLADSAGVGTVLLTGQRITFRGTPVSVEVCNVDGSNYFKLRDVAALLSGTGSGFSLSFDTELRAVLARRGESYTLVGGELQPGKDQASTAVPSRWLLYVDGALQPCDSVNVGGSNYFKLRDLGAALGFRVDYDQETRTVIIDP